MGEKLLHLGAARLVARGMGIEGMPQPQRTILRATGNVEHFVEAPVLAEEPW
ncbi:hypothetical protein [Mariniluteicoccus endophyticus]